jgi:hypothetical protein
MFQFLFAVAFHLNIHSERGFAPTPFGKAQKIQRQVLQGRTGGGIWFGLSAEPTSGGFDPVGMLKVHLLTSTEKY